eukprot:6805332-Pyramimonas_sp.AAC.1
MRRVARGHVGEGRRRHGEAEGTQGQGSRVAPGIPCGEPWPIGGQTEVVGGGNPERKGAGRGRGEVFRRRGVGASGIGSIGAHPLRPTSQKLRPVMTLTRPAHRPTTRLITCTSLRWRARC